MATNKKSRSTTNEPNPRIGTKTRATKAKTTRKRVGSSAKSKEREPNAPVSPSTTDEQTRFPIVGVGASAGGLEALQSFFKVMPDDPGFAIVVVVHLDEKQKSALAELLQECTPLRVNVAEDGAAVQVNQVYVIPPGSHITINRGRLCLSPRDRAGAIDVFLRSLASDRGSDAACVILSGTGSDGTLGVRAIKSEAGLTVAQDATARYDEMPRNAVLTGLVDFVLPAESIPAKLIEYLRTTAKFSSPTSEGGSDQSRLYQEVFSLLYTRTGRDFSRYKSNTVHRRIERRMAMHLLGDLGEYVDFLRRNEGEIHALFKELLIGVTNFFRDPEAFGALESVIADVIGQKANEDDVRMWVPGCSTGEEAYSIAMLVHEHASAAGKRLSVQIFATDIDEDAIETARRGLYPASIEADVSPERLKRFFRREDSGHYQVSKPVREMVVFAVQDVTKDPPFSRLDIVSCRNLLIYLSVPLQNHIFSLFHYSLRTDGVLFLGTSESVGTSQLFESFDRKHRLFRARSTSFSRNDATEFLKMSDVEAPRRLPVPLAARSALKNQLLFRAILNESDAPPCVVIDHAMNVVYVYGRTAPFLELPEGAANTNIVDMARPELRTAIATCVRTVVRTRKEAKQRGIQVESNGNEVRLDLVVKPILEPDTLAGMSIAFFHIIESVQNEAAQSTDARTVERDAGAVAELRRQLLDTQESLQTMIEELETSNEELKSTNEELQSTNEELQSSNEELQTSKEELQSINEESTTVNAELASRIEELASANDDLKNLLDSTGIATIFLDADLNVRRFTPGVVELVPLTLTDVGRPLSHFSTSFVDVDLARIASEVLHDLVTRECEIATTDSRFFLLRVRPYRTTQNVIDGTVLTFEDRTVIREAQSALKSRLDKGADELIET